MENDLQVRARAELEKRRILEEEGIETKYEKFVIAYADDPTNFVLDCINFNEGEQPDPYQHGAGKDLDVSTPLPTPTGWTTMGKVRAGDIILNEEGKPTVVIVAEEPKWRDAYKVTFSDKSSIIAGAGHLWTAIDVYNRPKTGEPNPRTIPVSDWRDKWEYAKTIETHEMAEKVKTRGGQLRWRIPTSKPLTFPRAQLPIDPYLLGAWLGDGASADGKIACSPNDVNELKDRIDLCGLETKIHKYKRNVYTLRIYGLKVALRELGVLNNKHIPMIYLRSSERQRRELLAGLMDTDGFRTGRNTDGICLCNKRLAKDVVELIRTFGIVARVAESDAKLYGRVVGRRWRINARFDECPFHYSRKRNGWKPRGNQASRHTQRTVTSVKPIGKRLTKCIFVNSKRGLFLSISPWRRQNYPNGVGDIVVFANT